MRNFKELKVWQKGIGEATKTYGLTDIFPKEGRSGIVRQVTRASVSIPSKYCGMRCRKTKKDYSALIGILPGSIFELETQVAIESKLNQGNQQLLQELKSGSADKQKKS